MSTKPDYEAAARVLRHRMSLPGGVTPDGDIRDIVDSALGGDPLAFAVAALIAEGVLRRQYREVAGQNDDGSLNGQDYTEVRYVSAWEPLPVESAEAKETP